MMLVRILLVEGHKIFRDGLKELIGNLDDTFQVIGTSENGKQAVEFALVNRPDIVVMDVDLPVMDGIRATKEILAELPKTGIIGLSLFGERWSVQNMIQAGARGYLVKSGGPEELRAALRNVSKGIPYFCNEVKRFLEEPR